MTASPAKCSSPSRTRARGRDTGASMTTVSGGTVARSVGRSSTFRPRSRRRLLPGADHALRHSAVERAEGRCAISSRPSPRPSIRSRTRTSASGSTARADTHIVRFYARGLLIKTHPRQAARRPGRSMPVIIPSSAASTPCAMSTALQRQADAAGDVIGRYAAALLDSPLPWTRMRRVYALLGLVRRYGAARVTEVCTDRARRRHARRPPPATHARARRRRATARRRPLASFRSPAISARRTQYRLPLQPRPLKERSPQ